jgi:hypothetical protein
MTADDDGEAAGALGRHLALPAEMRAAKWRHRLYDLLAEARLCQRDPRISIGADGFPYYALDVPRRGGSAGTIALSALVELATSSGFGVTINAAGAEAWTFTCGDLVTRRAFGTYEFPRIGMPGPAGPVIRQTRKETSDVSIGAPSATLLPSFVQPLLRRYFTDRLSIAEPGALAMLSAGGDPPEQLVFRLSRADFPNGAALEAALAGVTWFLPRHVVVSVLPPDVVAGLDRAFIPLL